MQINIRKRFLKISAVWIAAMLFLSGCVHVASQPEVINETEILLNFFEKERDYFNTGPSFVMTAQTLRTNLLTKPDKQYLIDIRSKEAFVQGHIKGSVNVSGNRGASSYISAWVVV